MSYVDQNLMSGEQVAYRAHLHWSVFVRPVILLALAVLAFMVKAIAGAVVLAIAVLAGAGAYLRYATSEFAVTNKRVIIKVGLVRRHSLETLLDKVESVSVNQGIAGRIFGYGTVTVNGTGATQEPFPLIADPLRFRRNMQEQIDAYTHRRAVS